LRHARAEWSVESMRRLPDVRFSEDSCRAQDETVQRILSNCRLKTIPEIFMAKHANEA
jgi:hypothetical protein